MWKRLRPSRDIIFNTAYSVAVGIKAYFVVYKIRLRYLLTKIYVTLCHLLLVLQHYNPMWVLAFSTSLFPSFLFLVKSFQFFTLITSISLRIPLIHLFLGLPAGRLPNCFQFIIYYRSVKYEDDYKILLKIKRQVLYFSYF